ncbi:unnamed protein product [Blepharisma stoltei]|uniref:Uncharacterized protein n=1 Tax=Blepharisma stoltei TaxID=1481888 RepID=A0AAU9JAL2_9CILI|nr:unnamed protein product [Blepharisma stoltei]
MKSVLKSKYINTEVNLGGDNVLSPTTVTVRQFVQKTPLADQARYLKRHQIGDYNKLMWAKSLPVLKMSRNLTSSQIKIPLTTRTSSFKPQYKPKKTLSTPRVEIIQKISKKTHNIIRYANKPKKEKLVLPEKTKEVGNSSLHVIQFTLETPSILPEPILYHQEPPITLPHLTEQNPTSHCSTPSPIPPPVLPPKPFKKEFVVKPISNFEFVQEII